MIKKEFENTLKKIMYYIRSYGYEKYIEKNNTQNIKNYQTLLNFCHEGFKIAQSIILKEIKNLNNSYSNLTDDLKEARRQGKTSITNNLTLKIKVNQYKTNLLRNLAFTIIWLIFNGKRELISRFYTGEKGSKELTGIGFEAIVRVAKDINKNQNEFAFICDLTNNIQIGDVIAVKQDRIEIIEVKTGKKNKEAINILNSFKINNIEISKERLEKTFDKKFAKQIARIHSQEEKMQKVKTIIDTDKGEDPKLKDTNVILPNSPITDTTYHYELNELIKKLDSQDYAYTCIMNIIHIGAYKNDWREFGKPLLIQLNNNFPVHDLMSTIGITISEPIFAKPFENNSIIDIALGHIKIYIGINYDMLIELGNDLNLPMRWSSKKELADILNNSKGNSKEIFSYDNKGIIIENRKNENINMFIGQGMCIRLMYDHISPDTLIQNRQLAMEQIINDIK
jgi:hypothetical protein